ncbi:hypothetical protein CI109_101380 [Kwoniella shandongensis]|uniref:WSC domain-containing protein n=1 Tax=Kwoniella shandongensis TaxID=1734106 RepID=A0AAJ8LDA7_9TREE
MLSILLLVVPALVNGAAVKPRYYDYNDNYYGNNNGNGRNNAATYLAQAQSNVQGLDQGWSAVGCYSDYYNGATLNKAAGASWFMTYDTCTDFCSDRGYEYAGVEGTWNCYCGDAISSSATISDYSNCGNTCPGNWGQDCGGSYFINVFHKATTTKPTKPSAAPSSSSSKSTAAASSSASKSASASASASSSTSASKSASSAAPASSSSSASKSASSAPAASSSSTSSSASKSASSAAAASSSSSSSAAASSASSSAAPASSASSVAPASSVAAVASSSAPASSASSSAASSAAASSSAASSAAPASSASSSVASSSAASSAAASSSASSSAAASSAASSAGLPTIVVSLPPVVPSSSAAASSAASSAESSSVASSSTSSAAVALPTIPVLPAGWSTGACVVEGHNNGGRALEKANYASSDMTQATCAAFCASKGHSIAGLEYSTECWCGDALTNGASLLKTSEGCNMPCGGASNTVCGGSGVLTLIVSELATQTLNAELTSRIVTLPTGWSAASSSCIQEGSSGRALGSASTSSSDMTIGKCLDFCDAAGWQYAGIEYGSECYCANSLLNGASLARTSDQCNMPCAGDSATTCGGSNGLQLYINPGNALDLSIINGFALQGCIQEVAGRAFTSDSFTDPAMTVEKCTSFCSSEGYTHAAIEYGSECYCGNGYSNGASLDLLSTQCTMSCPGNNKQTCGGPNALTTYASIGSVVSSLTGAL